MMKLPLRAFVDRCVAWCDEFNEWKPMHIADDKLCPVQIWVIENKHKCMGEMISSIAYCEVCGAPMCPDCNNHNVHQLSRVTGYISNVSGWNAAKKQELKDRNRNY